MLLSRAFLFLFLAIAPAAALAQSVPLPVDKPDASVEKAEEAPDAATIVEEAEEAPDADTTSAAPAEGEDALSNSCLQDLGSVGVVARRADAFGGDEQCVLDDPVDVEAVGTHTGNIALPGRPTLECRFAGVVGDWLREVVNPVAASVLGAHVEAVVTGTGHQCRRRAGGKLSEHGIGNAIDITAVRLVDGRSIRIESMVNAEGAELEFLRAISASACGYFTTVLGPGSDAAHADHLHVDLAERRTAEYRICMAR